MSAEAIAAQPERRERSGAGRAFGVILLIILIAAVAIAVVCLMPTREPIGAAGSPRSKRKLQAPLRALRDISKNRSRGRSFQEADINGYLEQEAVSRMGVINCSVDVRQGFLDVRMVRLLQPIEIGSFNYDLILSLDATYEESTRDGVLKVERGRIGKLPLVGKLAELAAMPIEKSLLGLKESEFFRHVESVRADEDVLFIRVRR